MGEFFQGLQILSPGGGGGGYRIICICQNASK